MEDMAMLRLQVEVLHREAEQDATDGEWTFVEGEAHAYGFVLRLIDEWMTQRKMRPLEKRLRKSLKEVGRKVV